MSTQVVMRCDLPGCSNEVDLIDGVPKTVQAPTWLAMAPVGAAWEWTFCSYNCLAQHVVTQLKALTSKETND